LDEQFFGGKDAHPYFCTPFEQSRNGSILMVDLVAQRVEDPAFSGDVGFEAK